MRVFISSVRHGLEAERDALPGLISALGHVPVRFEDFTAQPTPSREACLAGVASSDVYVLLLGPNYGHRFADTNQSPTHDEWMAARAAGKPTYVFRKDGVAMEPDQEAFTNEVGNYGTGVFYGRFTDATDLQAKVVKALRAHAAAPAALVFAPRTTPVSIRWKHEWTNTNPLQRDTEGTLELHVVGLDGTSIPSRMMLDLPDRLAGSLRTLGAVSMTAGLEPGGDRDSASVQVSATDTRSTPSPGALLGVHVSTTGQLSVWWSLPRDGLGHILDENILVQNLTDGLRLAGGLKILTGETYAIAAGLSGSMLVSRGTYSGAGRSNAPVKMNPQPVHIVLDEAVTSAAFDHGAPEVARPVTSMLLSDFDKTW
ncbi:DUF4062 domain-containing protein [Myceligenerans indicum]|uniref:DUF4062 domain-containing protein n=1 Tax=Myceligenerans indicum TaxID=2593663 RepID=A0ABS1LLG7_9MICO|nr:DUF4062 domain-containing protein [Myceligenerans indicum]MBL0886888.1 DUF4062 domain-containing protein [Myceligenerans indicum]